MVRVTFWCGGLFILLGSMGEAQQVDFAQDVLPILQTACLDCHGPDTAESRYRVDVRRIALRGGDLYPQLVVPGKAQDSPLFQILSGADPDLSMPPDGDRLSRRQLRIIEAWINQGASWPDAADQDTGPEVPHWSLQPLARPEVPGPVRPAATGSNHPVDAFLLHRLQAEGLTFSPEADRRVLLRRLSLVLTGLPPTIEDIERFVADQDPQAYERWVDHWLASPHLGERWARLWLDVTRFAESDGFETNHERPQAWPYRDYVIEAFNRDLPFDQFVREQIAGDQWGADAATGFLVGGAHDIVKGEDADLSITQRLDELADMINATTTTFLGLTVGCARCHHHKFDPISQSDYYALQAALSGVHHGERTLSQPADEARLQRADDLILELSALEEKLAAWRPPVTARANIERFAARRVRWVRFAIDATNQYEPCLDEVELFQAGTDLNVARADRGARVTSSGDFQGAAIHQLAHIHDGQYGNDHSWIASDRHGAWVQFELPAPETIDRIVWSRDRGWQGQVFRDRLPTAYRIEGSLDGEHWTLLASSSDRWDLTFHERRELTPEEAARGLQAPHAMWDLMDEIADRERAIRELRDPPRVYAGRFEVPQATYRLHRGDHRQPRELVAPEGLSALRDLTGSWGLDAESTDAQRRLALANWLAEPQNPLPQRVMVNRIWQGVFGTGLVATPSDFGAMGAPPSHPELLEWLACEWVTQGRSSKHLIRLLVTSEAFRQSSQPHDAGLQLDAASRWLWRFPPRRLDGEMIRDQILWVSGSLDLSLGGPGFSLFEPNANYARNWVPKHQFGPQEFRRMIYAQKLRMEPDAIFAVFDIPDGGQICPSRPRSTTPLQALNLYNSDFVLDHAERLAARIDSPEKAAAQAVREVFRYALLRDPDPAERDWAQAVAEEHGLAAVCRAVLNTNEFLWIE